MDNGFKFEKERRKMKTTTLSERETFLICLFLWFECWWFNRFQIRLNKFKESKLYENNKNLEWKKKKKRKKKKCDENNYYVGCVEALFVNKLRCQICRKHGFRVRFRHALQNSAQTEQIQQRLRTRGQHDVVSVRAYISRDVQSNEQTYLMASCDQSDDSEMESLSSLIL